MQILHQPAPGSEGDGSFNNLISALGLEGTLSKKINTLLIKIAWISYQHDIIYTNVFFMMGDQEL